MNDALNLPRISEYRCGHISETQAVRWLDDAGTVRMGRLLRPPQGCLYGLVFDELTHNYYLVHKGEYEPNVQKDANGNPVT
jgi:hypothetical protein